MSRSAAANRFAPRAAVELGTQLCDSMLWPRSRRPRLLSGDAARVIGRAVVALDPSELAGDDCPADAALLSMCGGPDDTSTAVCFDAAHVLSGGVHGFDDALAARLGATHHRPVRALERDVDKFVGYVPIDQFELVRDAVFDAGAGTIGNYDRCSFSVTGTGTFRGDDTTNPTVGTPGTFEHAEEVRFETVVPRHLVNDVARAYVGAHSYEEPAFDVLRMALPAPSGLGRFVQLGAGGGAHAWDVLGQFDARLDAYGSVTALPAGTSALVTVGPLRPLLMPLLDACDCRLVICTHASSDELDLLASRNMGVLVAGRTGVCAALAGDVCAHLSRELGVPVTRATDMRGAFDPAATTTATVTGDHAQADLAPTAAAGTWRMHFDGGSRGNPGPAAYGWVLYDPAGNEHDCDGVSVGRATNNVAEWTGLLRGLEHAAALGIRDLDVRGDSELVVKQITGVYRVKNAQLKPLAEEVERLLSRFDRVDIRHVYRTDNARADELANEALDGLR